jgi:hypothetical protein
LDLGHILELATIERATDITRPDSGITLHSPGMRAMTMFCGRYTDENRQFHLSVQSIRIMNWHKCWSPVPARFMVIRHAGLAQEETHKRIINALEAHDIEAARETLLDDIERSHLSIMDKVLEQKEIEYWQVG